MSQASNSTNNINNSSNSSIEKIDTTPKVCSKSKSKRFIPDKQEEIKKVKTGHQSVAEPVANVTPKFITAAEVAAADARRNIQAIPEISDEELLQMTLKFEMEHPQ